MDTPIPADLTAQAMLRLGAEARAASSVIAQSSSAERDEALAAAAAALRRSAPAILEANRLDIDAATRRGITSAFLDRLTLTEARVEAMANGLEDIAALADPVGRVSAEWTRPNGLRLSKVHVPLGVIGIIYESRPNVTADAGALCLKSGNATILRGGSESFHSSRAIHACLIAGLGAAGLPEAAIALVPTKDREAVGMMLAGLGGAIDVIIPRGGKSLVARVQDEARVPVFAHLEGVCHTYVHAAADPAKAQAIVVNAKMRRVSVCGATETLLIDRAVAGALLPPIAAALRDAGCALRGDDAARTITTMGEATEEDWRTEYLAPMLSVRVVDGIDAAVAHIARYGSQHTESIISEDAGAAARFLRDVDSAIVLHNASTQFADGGEFGFGGEIGIATGRLHARGPVGAEQLTTFKYVVHGDGQIRP